MAKTYNVTQSGLDALKQELHDLQEVQRPIAVDRLSKARAMGDLRENSEYHAAREGLNLIDGLIMETEYKIRNSVIVDDSHGDSSIVRLNNTIVVDLNGKEMTYVVVGELESDISAGRLSDTSPIGKALLGKAVGDTVEIKVPAGTINYLIKEIK